MGVHATEADFQIRMPLHLQYVPEGKKIGLAAWVILPNAMSRNNHTQTLLLAGPLIEYGKENWVELMGGVMKNDDGFIDPLVDLRFLNKLGSRWTVSGELAYFPSAEKQRFYSFTVVETPVRVGKYGIRVGLESENIIYFNGKKVSIGIGPRIIFPIPEKWIKPFKASIVVGYEFRNDRDFLRFYIPLSYRW